MKAARLYGVRDVRIHEEPVPQVEPGSELVRVTAVGLCGSDLHWYAEAGIGDAALTTPLVLGHELAGVVEGGPRHGLRVAVDPAIPCEQCASCRAGYRNLCPSVGFAGHGTRDGGLREFLTWPSHLLHPLPDDVSDVEGAMLEPLGVAIHALDLGHLRLGASIAVVGCGPIGLLLLQAARAAGAATIIAADPLPHRREAALRFGADHVWDGTAGPEAIAFLADVTEGGVDVGFEIAGTDLAVEAAMLAARPGARVVLAGIPDGDRTSFPAGLARRKGLTLALSRRMNETYPRAIQLVRSKRVDAASVVSDRYRLERCHEAFAAAARRSGLKVVLEPAA